MGILIRNIESDDVSAIAQIYTDTMKATHQGVVSKTFLESLAYEHSRRRIQGMLDKTVRRPFCYIAEVDGRVVEFAIGSFAISPPQGYKVK